MLLERRAQKDASEASSQPIAPAVGLAPPQPAGKSIAYSAAVEGEAKDCEFLFAVLAEKHNAVIRKIREIPPWEWGSEFLELEPQVRASSAHSPSAIPNAPRLGRLTPTPPPLPFTASTPASRRT